MNRCCCAAAALLVAACGNPEPADGAFAVTVPMPWEAGSIACPNVNSLKPNLTATLEIGGHDACELEVNPQTMAVSGACDHIAASTVRPMLLSYVLQLGAPAQPVPIAFFVGSLNLCEDVPSNGEVTFTFGQSAATSTFVYREIDLDALPGNAETNDCGGQPSCAHTLTEAQKWAKCKIFEGATGRPLDVDSDDVNAANPPTANGKSNLEEACNGTLN